ncbi:hypothetical protein AAC387_Pa05g3439 [Persea americana]
MAGSPSFFCFPCFRRWSILTTVSTDARASSSPPETISPGDQTRTRENQQRSSLFSLQQKQDVALVLCVAHRDQNRSPSATTDGRIDDLLPKEVLRGPRMREKEDEREWKN